MDRDDREHFKTMNSQSAGQRTGSKSGSSATASQPSRHDPHSCLAKAKAIFSCYRRDEAQDPDGFTANLALVLGDYHSEIVDLAADPRTGVITVFPMGLPNVGQIRQFLEDKLAHRDRLQHLGSLPKPEFKRLPKPPVGPGALANVFVPASDRNYARMVEKAKTADAREYRFDETPGHVGIFVSLTWFEAPDAVKRTFKVPTIDDLTAMYARQPDMDQGEAA